MVISPLSLRSDYWDTFQIQEKDLDYLYNQLLELETPLTTSELTFMVVTERINSEKKALENRATADGKVYLPKDHYEVGDSLVFPAMGWKKGKVTAVRKGFNPEIPAFEVLDVEFEKGSKRSFAALLESHRLNQPVEIKIDDPNLIPDQVMKKHGAAISRQLDAR